MVNLHLWLLATTYLNNPIIWRKHTQQRLIWEPEEHLIRQEYIKIPNHENLYTKVMKMDPPFPRTQHQKHPIKWLSLVICLIIAPIVLLSACSRLNKDATTVENDPSMDAAGAAAPVEAINTPSLQALRQDLESQGTPEAELDDETTSIILPTPDPWDGKGRVTILVMGLDYGDWDSPGREGPPRSDTMMLLTVDPVSHTAGMLSIPRDLWVTIPGIEGYHKINTAHRFGEYYKMPGGGPGLAMRTVKRLLEVPINFYAIIDFYAFEDLIDELGGVEIDVPYEIKVDPIGPNNTVVLEPGLQLLDGPTALAYARNRYTPGGDFDRAGRQQQVIIALREQVFSLQALPKLIYNASSLYRQLSAGIRTNMTLEQAIKLAWLVREVQPEDIKHAVIGNGEVIYDRAEDGQAIFRPVIERIHALRDEIFTRLTTEELIAAENPRITLVNESGNPALSKQTARYLEEMGLNVIESIQGEGRRDLTRLVDKADNPNTLRYLIRLLHVRPSEIYIQYDLDAGTDMFIYLGADWADDNPMK
jgi:polyisoprenyl-teichoic acid--peptidoglycan teichoic acid transferase